MYDGAHQGPSTARAFLPQQQDDRELANCPNGEPNGERVCSHLGHARYVLPGEPHPTGAESRVGSSSMLRGPLSRPLRRCQQGYRADRETLWKGSFVGANTWQILRILRRAISTVLSLPESRLSRPDGTRLARWQLLTWSIYRCIQRSRAVAALREKT
jgi:hypothetical protein